MGKGGEKNKKKPTCPSVQGPQGAGHGAKLAGGKQLIRSTGAVTISSIKVQDFFLCVPQQVRKARYKLRGHR